MTDFNPDWTVAPGETLGEWMEENRVSLRMLAKATKLDVPVLSELVAGELDLSEDIAARLERATGITARFWIAYEKRYRADLALGRTRL